MRKLLKALSIVSTLISKDRAVNPPAWKVERKC
jgi:hypothetical protein